MGGCETHSAGLTHRPPGSQHPSEPRLRQTTTQQAFLTRDHRPPLAGVKLVPPRRCAAAGVSSLTPDPRGGTETSSCEETQHNSHPADYQVTGSEQHALLTAKAPMGVSSGTRQMARVIVREPLRQA